MLSPKIVPTIATSSEKEYEVKLRQIENLVDRVQIDIMDGQFANNETVGASTVEKFATLISRDIHLMVGEPLSHIGEFARLGVDRIIFHFEACKNREEVEAVVEEIKMSGNRVGLALNLETPVSAVDPFVEGLDLVQLMAVSLGFSGQKFNPAVLPKALALRQKYPDLSLAVDGGVSRENAAELVSVGVTELVLASHLFEAPSIESYIDGMKIAIAQSGQQELS